MLIIIFNPCMGTDCYIKMTMHPCESILEYKYYISSKRSSRLSVFRSKCLYIPFFLLPASLLAWYMISCKYIYFVTIPNCCTIFHVCRYLYLYLVLISGKVKKEAMTYLIMLPSPFCSVVCLSAINIACSATQETAEPCLNCQEDNSSNNK